MSGEEFLALLVPHVLLRYQVTSRGYRAASTRIRRQFGWTAKEAAGVGPPAVGVIVEDDGGFERVRRRNWARLIAKVYLEDPEICSLCRDRMKVLAAIFSPAQDAVIEKILRARGEWDPPWARQRPARGPPTGEAAGPRRPSGETRIEYDEGYDARREEWEVDREFESRLGIRMARRHHARLALDGGEFAAPGSPCERRSLASRHD